MSYSLTKAIVYQANFTGNICDCEEKVYLCVLETSFKVRIGNHRKMFTKRGHRNNTELFQIVLESKTTERKIHHKVGIIKRTLRLQSKERTMYIMPR